MLTRRIPMHFACVTAILLATQESNGQNRGGSLGGFGSSGSSFGTSQFGGSSFSQSGGGSLGGISFGQSSGFGQSSFGTSGSGGFGTSGLGSSGASATGTTPFVGRSAADMRAFFGSTNSAFVTPQQSTRSGRSRSSGSSEAGRRPLVRVRLMASPELQRAASERRSEQATLSGQPANTMMRLLARRGLTDVSVESAGDTVILTGTVESESKRRLAEKLFAIEPGVRLVNNQLQLASNVPEIVPAPR